MEESSIYTNGNDESIFIDLNSLVFIISKLSPEDIRKKCREYVKLPNQPKYKDFIEKLFKESNQKFIDINIED